MGAAQKICLHGQVVGLTADRKLDPQSMEKTHSLHRLSLRLLDFIGVALHSPPSVLAVILIPGRVQTIGRVRGLLLLTGSTVEADPAGQLSDPLPDSMTPDTGSAPGECVSSLADPAGPSPASLTPEMDVSAISLQEF